MPAPLSWLTPLSARVLLYRPSLPPAPGSPKLILLATWMGALPAHIAKYAEPYRAQYPTSPIMIVRSEPSDFFWPRGAHKEMATAAAAIKAAFDVGGPGFDGSTDVNGTAIDNGAVASPQLLIHAWSNGGSTTLWRIRAFLKSLPAYTFLLDSAPGQFNYRATYTAFSLTLTPWLRRLLAPALHAMCTFFWLMTVRDRVLDRCFAPKPRGPLAVSAASHNDSRWVGAEVRRTYIFSEEDALIRASDVRAHAAAARRAGFTVREELFKGTAHVAHARYEPERYWAIAKETWTGEKAKVEEEVLEVLEEINGVEEGLVEEGFKVEEATV